MSLVTSFSLFFLSFAPLWISILFIDIRSVLENQSEILTEKYSIVVILILSLVSFLILKRFFNKEDKSGAQEFVIETVEEEKTITSEYLLSYILPLFAFDFTVWHQVVLFIIFFSVLAFLCIKHNYFSVNIVLELLGYRFYKCVLQNEDRKQISRVIVSKERLLNQKAEKILVRPVNNEYSIDITEWNNRPPCHTTPHE